MSEVVCLEETKVNVRSTIMMLMVKVVSLIDGNSLRQQSTTGFIKLP